eukprot:1078547-Amorphochlora_amoeboformis.AAC.1
MEVQFSMLGTANCIDANYMTTTTDSVTRGVKLYAPLEAPYYCYCQISSSTIGEMIIVSCDL